MLLDASAEAVIFISTTDRQTADAFYNRTLGLPMIADDGFAAIFDLSGAKMRITANADHVAGPHPVLGWQVDDIGIAVGTLADRGVTMIVYDGMGQDARGVWTSPDGKTKVVFFHDPDRNVLSLTES